MLVMLALATHVTTARAVTPSTTITQTAITSPGDPSYFYDPTAGAYGGVTVTGTTNSSDPSVDTVDIDCYTDDGSQQDPSFSIGTLVSGVSLDSSGGFSALVPYSAIEQAAQNGVCRLRAVPSASAPTSGLGSFQGPRLMLAYLLPAYSSGSASALWFYDFEAPQLGAINRFSSAGGYWDCGFNMALASSQYFGESTDNSFECSDWFLGPNGSFGALQVDGQNANTAWDGPSNITVSAVQNPANGDTTIHEAEPLSYWNCSGVCTWTSLGVEDDRTIETGAAGHVVLITDRFVSTDGAAHQVDYSVASRVNNGIYRGSSTSLFEFPGETSFSAHAGGDTVDAGSTVPGTIYSYNDTYSDGSTDGFDAITYFQAPSDVISFADPNTPVIPFALTVPAGGAQSLSMQYSSEYSQAALAGDLATGRDLKAGPSVTISAPTAGSTVSTSSVTVTGSATADSGIRSVTVNGVSATVSGSSFSAVVPLKLGDNTLTAELTTNAGVLASSTESVAYDGSALSNPVGPAVQGFSGAVWLPIANTGGAHRAGAAKERLSGTITAGSAGVTYYFEYGTRGRLNRRSRAVELAAGKTGRRVTLTIGGLSHGAKYSYRLIATGTYGHAAGRSRSFKTTARRK